MGIFLAFLPSIGLADLTVSFPNRVPDTDTMPIKPFID